MTTPASRPCCVCGSLTEQRCSGCQTLYFCSMEHQKLVRALSTFLRSTGPADDAQFRSGQATNSSADRTALRPTPRQA